jgi:hypothetical protein
VRPDELLARHLDLRPLRGRRRGVVRCRFHDDHHASLSIDLDRGFFNCFACGVKGGPAKFAELVGVAGGSPSPRSHQADLPGDALRAVYRSARRTLSEAGPLYRYADEIRGGWRDVDEARRAATGDTEDAWNLLEHAARLEVMLFAEEAR